MNSRTRSAPWRRRGTAVGVLIVVLTMAPPAYGHSGDESSEADVLVRQAIALIVNTPRDKMAVEDKITDALGDKVTTTVDLKLVAKAKTELAKGDIHTARAYLEASVGARPHTEVGHLHPILVTARPLVKSEVQAAVDRATGAESGTNVAIDGLPSNRKRDAGTWVALVSMITIMSGGVALAFRYRPPVALRDFAELSSNEEHGG